MMSKKEFKIIGTGAAVGVMFGAVIGYMTDSMGIFIALGCCLGPSIALACFSKSSAN